MFSMLSGLVGGGASSTPVKTPSANVTSSGKKSRSSTDGRLSPPPFPDPKPSDLEECIRIIVNSENVEEVISATRKVAELVVYAEQRQVQPVVDLFFERNVTGILRSMALKGGVNVDLQLQILQTFSILAQSLRNEINVFQFLSQNHLNLIIMHEFDFVNAPEELLAHYISLLKTVALRLDRTFCQFFFDARTAQNFPLYDRAVEHFASSEPLVRAAVRSIVLMVFRVDDAEVDAYVCKRIDFFQAMCTFIRQRFVHIKEMIEAEEFSPSWLSRIDSGLSDVLDDFSFIQDVLSMREERRTHLETFQDVVIEEILNPLLADIGNQSNLWGLAQSCLAIKGQRVLEHVYLGTFGDPDKRRFMLETNICSTDERLVLATVTLAFFFVDRIESDPAFLSRKYQINKVRGNADDSAIMYSTPARIRSGTTDSDAAFKSDVKPGEGTASRKDSDLKESSATATPDIVTSRLERGASAEAVEKRDEIKLMIADDEQKPVSSNPIEAAKESEGSENTSADFKKAVDSATSEATVTGTEGKLTENIDSDVGPGADKTGQDAIQKDPATASPSKKRSADPVHEDDQTPKKRSDDDPAKVAFATPEMSVIQESPRASSQDTIGIDPPPSDLVDALLAQLEIRTRPDKAFIARPVVIRILSKLLVHLSFDSRLLDGPERFLSEKQALVLRKAMKNVALDIEALALHQQSKSPEDTQAFVEAFEDEWRELKSGPLRVSSLVTNPASILPNEDSVKTAMHVVPQESTGDTSPELEPSKSASGSGEEETKSGESDAVTPDKPLDETKLPPELVVEDAKAKLRALFVRIPLPFRMPMDESEKVRVLANIFMVLRLCRVSLEKEPDVFFPAVGNADVDSIREDAAIDLRRSEFLEARVLLPSNGLSQKLLLVLVAGALLLVEPDDERRATGICRSVAPIHRVDMLSDAKDSSLIHLRIRSARRIGLSTRVGTKNLWLVSVKFEGEPKAIFAQEQIRRASARTRDDKFKRILDMLDSCKSLVSE